MIARGRALAAWGRGTRTQELVTEIGRLTEVARRKGLRLSATDLERAQTAAAVY